MSIILIAIAATVYIMAENPKFVTNHLAHWFGFKE
jgi:hypothetical protein